MKIETCKPCNGEGITIINQSVPKGKDGKYGICQNCGGSGSTISESISSQF